MQNSTRRRWAVLGLPLLLILAWFLFFQEARGERTAVGERGANPESVDAAGQNLAGSPALTRRPEPGEASVERKPVAGQAGETQVRDFVVSCVDLATGDPVAGVKLEIQSLRFRKGKKGPTPGRGGLPGKPVVEDSFETNARGRVVFALPVEVTWVHLQVEKQGFQVFGRSQVFPVTVERVRILLYKKLLLQGAVVDEQGRPVSRARLALASLSTRKNGGATPYSQFLGDTDSEGRFAFEAPKLQFGRTRIVAWKRGYRPFFETLVLRPPQARVFLRLVMKKGNSFSFLIKDMKGKPVRGAKLDLTQYEYPADWGGHVRGHELGGMTMGIGASHNLESDAEGMIRVENWPTGIPAVFSIGGRPEGKAIIKVAPAFPVKRPERKIPRLILFQPETDQVYTVFLELLKEKHFTIKGKVYAAGSFDRSKFLLKVDIGGGTGSRLRVKWAKDRFEARYRHYHGFVKSGITTFKIRVFLDSKELASFGPYDYYKDSLIQGLIVNIP